MFKRSWLSVAIAALAVSGCSATYESAEESYQEGNVAEAREAWQELATNGDARSMHRLYTSTNRPSEDDLSWLKQAADAGLTQAQYDYGMVLFKKEQFKDAHSYLTSASDGDLVAAKQFLQENEKLFPLWIKSESGDAAATKKVAEHYWNKKEYKNATKWFERCSNRYRSCSFYIGLSYDQGYGVTEDNAKAIEWYTKSAENNGYTAAARNLAWMYENGEGTAIDKKKAFYWMSQAEKSQLIKGVTTAELGRYYLYGIGTEKNTKKAYDLLNRVAKSNEYAAYNLAKMYYFGDGVKRDYNKSYEWFLVASKKGHRASEYYVGNHHYHGYGRDKNLLEAYQWFKKSADKGYVDAQFRLGWMLSSSEGVAKNYREAFKWYQKAADQGSSTAQNNLGYMYDNGQGTEKNKTMAFEWYQKAARLGSDVGQYNVGQSYKVGSGVRKSDQLAAYWLAKAAQQNYKSAQSSLEQVLPKLRRMRVNVKETEVYSKQSFDSQPKMSLGRGTNVYLLSQGSKWTEIYYPKNHTIGYINNTHLY
ncbi:tetratricopeptide repeat protein [Vibrio nereis]|uniref:Cobalamin biosynthesis protein CobT n=1 Tax=Vibrio nereis TaxID=693 RepID=A0A0M0HRW2_VIBNE|nr:tetratricopeptide repeat protein [Vibrio nereis]KOO04825.1 hypothetical protein AKJ17_03935 [Vibrio nereis]